MWSLTVVADGCHWRLLMVVVIGGICLGLLVAVHARGCHWRWLLVVSDGGLWRWLMVIVTGVCGWRIRLVVVDCGCH